MGYYSEVAYVMAFEDNEKRDAFHELVRLRKDEMSKQLEQYCAKDDREPWITYHQNSIKWYGEFTEIKAHHDMMKLCVECGGAYRFLRVGEETDDIEDASDGADDGKVEVPWDAFYMQRSIECC